MSEQGNVVIGISIDLLTVEAGDVIRLKDGRDGVVVDNIDDGQWLEMDLDGEVELIHSQDMIGFVKRAGD